PLGIGDVLSLAKQPTRAIRHLLAPEDLVKLGAALRDRTSNLFEGMFEPAAPPPTDAKVDAKVDAKLPEKVEPPATPTTEEATATEAKPE
ncbi:MAG: hypothetical protein NT062_37250, partial [Proteobacteria bacterium]|nr:hypothetical protein [Pseudomonadota bacterium]